MCPFFEKLKSYNKRKKNCLFCPNCEILELVVNNAQKIHICPNHLRQFLYFPSLIKYTCPKAPQSLCPCPDGSLSTFNSQKNISNQYFQRDKRKVGGREGGKKREGGGKMAGGTSSWQKLWNRIQMILPVTWSGIVSKHLLISNFSFSVN